MLSGTRTARIVEARLTIRHTFHNTRSVTKLVSFRIEEALIDSLDKAREEDGRGRSEVVREALQLWLRQRELADRIRRHEEGYRGHPVEDAEFTPVLGAQEWPK